MELSGLARFAASVVAPPRCALCAAGCEASSPLCPRCRERLATARPLISSGPPAVDSAVAVGDFGGVVRELAIAIKFGHRLSLIRPAAEAMVAAAPAGLLDGAVIAVPASPIRRRWRGFDPGEEIARAVAKAAQLPFARCLRRGDGPRQVGRLRSERVCAPPSVRLASQPPPRAVLVDDVHTTGATLGACARALRRGGSERVVALTLARVR